LIYVLNSCAYPQRLMEFPHTVIISRCAVYFSSTAGLDRFRSTIISMYDSQDSFGGVENGPPLSLTEMDSLVVACVTVSRSQNQEILLPMGEDQRYK